MELTVLGSSGTWPGPGRATCGYLVSHDGAHLWLDAGSGTFARLQERIRVDQMTAIVISHGHPDHFSDMLMCFYARRYGGLGDPERFQRLAEVFLGPELLEVRAARALPVGGGSWS